MNHYRRAIKDEKTRERIWLDEFKRNKIKVRKKIELEIGSNPPFANINQENHRNLTCELKERSVPPKHNCCVNSIHSTVSDPCLKMKRNFGVEEYGMSAFSQCQQIKL